MEGDVHLFALNGAISLVGVTMASDEAGKKNQSDAHDTPDPSCYVAAQGPVLFHTLSHFTCKPHCAEEETEAQRD